MRATSFTIAMACSLAFSGAQAATFCAWKIPNDDKRWINLTVVQYIDVGDEDVRIAFGGGNLGSGYDIRIPTKSREDGAKILKAMQDASKQCDR